MFPSTRPARLSSIVGAFVVHEEKNPGRSEPGQRFVAACVKREQIAANIAKLPELLAA